MKMFVDMDERWPEYSLDETNLGYSKYVVEVPRDLYERHKSALAEFNEVQDEIEKLIKEQN